MFLPGTPIPPAIARLNDLLWGFAGHRVLTVSARLGLLESLARQASTAAELAASLGIDPLATGKLVRALCALGLVRPAGEGSEPRYRLAGELTPFFTVGDFALGPFLDHFHDLYSLWGDSLEAWARGQRQPRHVEDPEGLRRFGEAMRSMGNHLAPQVLAALQPERVHRGLDLGGGIGGFAIALCRNRLDLEVEVLDLPEVVEHGRAEVARLGLSDRIRFRPGSYFEAELGEGYDLVLLANVLHQEHPEAAARLVARGARALAPGGRLAVVDFAIDAERQASVSGTLSAVNMFSFGDTYTEPEIRGWLAAAGLAEIRRVDLFPVHWLIFGRRR